MNIYTKQGDFGQTDLMDGVRIDKSAPEIALMAALDELNANIGAARAYVPAFDYDFLRTIKNVMSIMALIADPNADVDAPQPMLSGASYAAFFLQETAYIESKLDTMSSEGLFNDWVVYGGCRESAIIDVARAVCRRAEVLLCGAAISRLNCAAGYINRLSDFLYGCARRADKIHI